MPVRFVGELPPTKHKTRLAIRRVADKLKERPGAWAAIRHYPTKRKQAGYVYAHNCRTGRNRTLSPEMGFLVKAMADGRGGVTVYAAYVGRNDEYLGTATSSAPSL